MPHSPHPRPSPPDRTRNRFQGWLPGGGGDLRQEGWPEQRVSLSTRGQMTRLSPKFCSQGWRPRRASSQLVAWWTGRFRAGIQVPSCVCHWWWGGGACTVSFLGLSFLLCTDSVDDPCLPPTSGLKAAVKASDEQ